MMSALETKITESPQADAERIALAVRADVAPQPDLIALTDEPAATSKPRSLLKNLVWTAITSFGVMGVNFVTGVLVCRLLAAEGRGQIAAIGAWTQIFGWAAGMGFYEAITYIRARNTDEPKRILGSAVLVTLLFGTLGVVIAELLVNHGFSHQTADTVSLARLWMLTIYLGVAGSMFNALITGNQEFGLLNVLRLIQPMAYLVGLLGLWLLHRFTVFGVMATATSCEFCVTMYLFIRLLRTIGIGWPSAKILKEGLKYGARVQGALFASLANARLDMMLLASLTTSAAIGLYSVSTNLSGIIVALLGSFGVVMFPTATRAGAREGLPLIARSLRFVFWAGALGSATFFVLCPFLLHIVYGAKFDGAVTSLRLLLPGVVAVAATKIVDSGLQSVNKPQKASYAQLLGLTVTLLGLWLTLRRWGINGAAITSTLSYGSTFLLSLFFLSREPEFSVRQAFSLPLFIGDFQVVWKKFNKPRSVDPKMPGAAVVA
jgi:antigen flippase